MARPRVAILVEIDLDPKMSTMSTPEIAAWTVGVAVERSLRHLNPEATLHSADVTKKDNA